MEGLVLGGITTEQVFLVVVAGLLAWVTGGRTLMGLIALSKERGRRHDVTALFREAATEMAAQFPEQELEELTYLLDALQQRLSKSSYDALLHLLRARIDERLKPGRTA